MWSGKPRHEPTNERPTQKPTEPMYEPYTDDETTNHTDKMRAAMIEQTDADEVSDDEVFEAARIDASDADGNLIIRFGGNRDGGVSFETDNGSMFRGFYSPTDILIERFDLRDGVEAALATLEDYADLRRVSESRMGVFYVDEDEGRISDVKFLGKYIEPELNETITKSLVSLANRTNDNYYTDPKDGGDGDGDEDDVGPYTPEETHLAVVGDKKSARSNPIGLQTPAVGRVCDPADGDDDEDEDDVDRGRGVETDGGAPEEGPENPPSGDEAPDGWTDYKVPLTAYGGVTVRARNEDEAVDWVNGTPSFVSAEYLSLALDRNEADNVREASPHNTPENISESSSGTMADVPDVPFVRELRSARKRLDISRKTVADRLDVSVSTVGKWEREDNAISLEQAREYAGALRDIRSEEGGKDLVTDGGTDVDTDEIAETLLDHDRGHIRVTLDNGQSFITFIDDRHIDHPDDFSNGEYRLTVEHDIEVGAVDDTETADGFGLYPTEQGDIEFSRDRHTGEFSIAAYNAADQAVDENGNLDRWQYRTIGKIVDVEPYDPDDSDDSEQEAEQ